MKWATKLSESDIQYQSHTTIKVQVLVDFLVEVAAPEEETPWEVFVDGSSTSKGIGMGVVLFSSQGDKVKLVVLIDYCTSNNEIEYEILLIEL